MPSRERFYAVPEPGVYRHYKGGLYLLMFVASEESTLDSVVVYASLLDGRYWTRPVSTWVEMVDTVEGRRPRYERVQGHSAR